VTKLRTPIPDLPNENLPTFIENAFEKDDDDDDDDVDDVDDVVVVVVVVEVVEGEEDTIVNDDVLAVDMDEVVDEGDGDGVMVDVDRLPVR